MSEVFISYSKADRAFAEALSSDLKASGISVWWDSELYAGDDFHDAIQTAIDKSKAVIVVWSITAARSRWVRDEAERALRHDKLITTHVPGFDLRDTPLGFGQRQCEDVQDRPRVLRALERYGIVPAPSTQPPLETAANQIHDGGTETTKDRLTREIERRKQAEPLFRCGREYDKKRDFAEAITSYSKAIELDTTYSAVYYYRGLAYQEQRDLDRAIEDFSKLIDLEQRQADLRELIFEFSGSKPKQNYLNLAFSYYVRSNAYEKRGDEEQANADFDKAIELNAACIIGPHRSFFEEVQPEA